MFEELIERCVQTLKYELNGYNVMYITNKSPGSIC